MAPFFYSTEIIRTPGKWSRLYLGYLSRKTHLACKAKVLGLGVVRVRKNTQ